MANDKKLIYADDARRAILKADPKLAYCIDKLKAVDAVEVVRCNYCKKWEYDQNFSGLCTEWRIRTLGDHFCSYGERKDNE